ncbi:hypothetical protein AMK59_3241, partial [Oryctes borbonicus]
CYSENLEVVGADTVIGSLEGLILLLTVDDERYCSQLKLALKCAVRLCDSKRQYCEKFVDLLGSRLGSIDSNSSIIICEALGAIGSLQPDTLLPLIDDTLKFLTDLSQLNQPTQQQIITKIMLCTLIFQSLCGHQWNPRVLNVIYKSSESNNLWANYRIARAAVRYGHHEIALNIFSGLTEEVSSEHLHFWLLCLKEMCAAEAKLLENGDGVSVIDKLDFAVIHYNRAIAALKAASTPTHNLQFQAEYMRIRAEFLQCLIQLVHTCNTLCIVPPPAIAASIVQSSRDEFQRLGYITNQMRKCVKDFKACGDTYWKLYQTAFDADPATLENIQILQQMCVLLEQCVENVCSASNHGKDDLIQFISKNAKLECRQLILACENAAKIAQTISQDQQTITHVHVETLRSIAEVLSAVLLPIPRFFFQVLQSTSVKLSISPQPRVMGEFISVQSGSQLAVKVEGVIQHGHKPGLFRKVEGVIVTVTSQLQANSKNKDIDLKVNKYLC